MKKISLTIMCLLAIKLFSCSKVDSVNQKSSNYKVSLYAALRCMACLTETTDSDYSLKSMWDYSDALAVYIK